MASGIRVERHQLHGVGLLGLGTGSGLLPCSRSDIEDGVTPTRHSGDHMSATRASYDTGCQPRQRMMRRR